MEEPRAMGVTNDATLEDTRMSGSDHNNVRGSEDTYQTTSTSSKRDSAIGQTPSAFAQTTKSDAGKSKRQKMKDIGQRAKIKTRSLISKPHDSPEEVQAEEDDYDDPYEEIHNPAFDPALLISPKQKGAGAKARRALKNVRTGVEAVIHPLNTAKRKAASKVAVEDEPYLSESADRDYLEAHDHLDQAKSRGRSRADHTNGNYCDSDVENIEDDKERIWRLEELRRNRKVAWTTSHHIKRVLVVPKREVPPPNKEDFYVYDEASGRRRLDWCSWLKARHDNAVINFAHNSMRHVDFGTEVPFDRADMSRQISRLLVASSPWQTWFSSLRQLYRWEDRRKTQRWLLIWFFIWYFDFVVTFILAYVAFITLENKFRSQNATALRESYNRTRDRNKAAYKFNELTTKHGNQWLEPAVDEFGPILQLQIADAASLLETLNNFYDWRVPHLTWATLFWFLCATLLGISTSTQYSMKIIWMFCILDFFLGFWVSSLHPKYRHIVNSLKWIWWDIPDDTQWSLMYLRERAQETRARLIERQVQIRHDHEIDLLTTRKEVSTRIATNAIDAKPIYTATLEDAEDSDMDSDEDGYMTADSSTSILGGLDILSFRCHHNGVRGRLIIYSDGLRFERLAQTTWRRSWIELVEIRKLDESALPGLPKVSGLAMVFTDGEPVRLEGVTNRDRAFNCIIGFSGLRFQVLPSAAEVDHLDLIEEMKEVKQKAEVKVEEEIAEATKI